MGCDIADVAICQGWITRAEKMKCHAPPNHNVVKLGQHGSDTLSFILFLQRIRVSTDHLLIQVRHNLAHPLVSVFAAVSMKGLCGHPIIENRQAPSR